MTARSCQGRSIGTQRAAKTAHTYSSTRGAGICLIYNTEKTLPEVLRPPATEKHFQSGSRSHQFMQGCASGLSLANFCKISCTARCHSIAFTRKSQGATRHELVGEQAWFLLEEHFALGQRGEDMSHSILSNQQQVSALCLFSCWIGDGASGSERSLPWPATNLLSPFTAQLSGSTPASCHQKASLSPEAREEELRCSKQPPRGWRAALRAAVCLRVALPPSDWHRDPGACYHGATVFAPVRTKSP